MGLAAVEGVVADVAVGEQADDVFSAVGGVVAEGGITASGGLHARRRPNETSG